MVGMNRAALIAQIGALTTPKVTEGRSLDIAGAVNSFNQGYDRGRQISAQKELKEKTNALAEALTRDNPQDTELISADPMAYVKMLQDNKTAERDQQYKMDVLGRQFENALALEDKKNANAISLAKIAASLKGNGTTGMQNIEYLQTLGYSPEEAAALYYGGQNPNLILNGVGKKGTEAYDTAIGKDIAEKEIKYKDALREKSSFDDTANRLEELLPKAELETIIKRYRPTMTFEPDVQQARQEIINTLGGLRLDQMQYLKGAISDKEQQFLADITSGDIKKYTPNQIKGTLNSIRRKMNSEVEKYKPQSLIPTDEDAWGGI